MKYDLKPRAHKMHGDPATTGRSETASERRKRKRQEQRVRDCAVPWCRVPEMRDGLCPRHWSEVSPEVDAEVADG